MCPDPQPTTLTEVAKDLRKASEGVTFTDPYRVVNPKFREIIDTVAHKLSYMMSADTPADPHLLKEMIYQLAHAILYGSDPYAAGFDEIEAWLYRWSSRL